MEPAPSPTVVPSDGIRARRGVRHLIVDAPIAVWLVVLVAVAALARFVVALAAPAPWIFPDEWVYSELARSFSQSGEFEVWGVSWPVRASGPLYPMLISPAYALTDSVEHAYVIVKAINALAMSLAAVPVYLLARRLVRSRLAFLAVVLALLVPAMVYTAKVMTESVAYPIFLTTALAIVRVLERRSAAREAVVIGLLALSFLVRAEMVVLIPVYVSAIVLLAVFDARVEGGALVRRVAAYRTSWAAGLAATLVVAAGMGTSGSAFVFGVYERLPSKIRLLEAPRWLLYHVAEIDLAVGVIPFAAFFVVVGLIAGETTGARAPRVFTAVAIPVFLWFMALGAVYGTTPRPLPHVFERYVFYVMPFLVIGFVFWVERGLPRPRKTTLLVAAVACLLPVALPYATLLNGREWGVSSSTPGLVPWAMLSPILGKQTLMVVAVLAVTAALALVFLRAGPAKQCLAVLTTLWVLTLVVTGANLSASKLADSYRGSAAPNWVDAAVGADAEVAVVWAGLAGRGSEGPYAVLENQFFNRSVRAVYDLREPIKPQMPSRAIADHPIMVDYVLADALVKITGQPIASNTGARLVLYRVRPPVRLVPPAGSPVR